jgi:addiction module HigA family antidote
MSRSRESAKLLPPPRPGDVLRLQIFANTAITQERLAGAMKVSRYSINQLVNNRRAVTPEMALRLAKATSTTPEFWLNLQRNFDLFEAKKKLSPVLHKVEIVRSPQRPEAMFVRLAKS